MNFNEIKRMATGLGINTYGMKKTDAIRSIQRAENNIDCCGTAKVDGSNEDACLWRSDCLPIRGSYRKEPEPNESQKESLKSVVSAGGIGPAEIQQG